MEEIKRTNPDGKITFIKSDTSLLKNVDKACEQIKKQEEKVNLLFMTQGYLTLDGRKGSPWSNRHRCFVLTKFTETEEGLDRKFSLHYYSRMRFTSNLLPLLSHAASDNELSRVVTILAGGREAKVNEDDLELKHNFSLSSCANHATSMNSLACEELAKTNPGTSFLHISPGFVKTSLGSQFSLPLRVATQVLGFVLTPLAVPVGESGERHLFHATAKEYAARAVAGNEAVRGSTGEKGSGAYLLNWDGKVSGNDKVMRDFRERGVGSKVWSHTLGVFKRILG